MTLAGLLSRARDLAKLLLPKASAAAAWAWRNRTAVLAVLVVLLAALYLRSCGPADRAEGQAAAGAARAAGEAKAEAAGIPVVHQVPQASVDEEGERAKREVPGLRAQLEQARREMGKLRLELVARIQAEPGPVLVPVQQGERLQLGADLAVAETEDGAHLLRGELWAKRLPALDLVVRQAYSAPVTVAVTAPPTAPCPVDEARAWRLGPLGGVSGQGWLAGGAYTRRLDLWGWRPEVLVTVAGGPGQGLVLFGPLL